MRLSAAVALRTPGSTPAIRVEPLLAVRGVSINFGGIVALDRVSFDLEKDHILGLIGPNGAGKTTLFNVLTGLVPLTRGTVLLCEEDISRWSTHRRARAGIARTFQRLELFTRMTVEDNLISAWEGSHRGGVFGRGQGERRHRVTEVMDLLGLWPLSRRLAGELPTGQGRLVELGRALCTDPRVLLQ
jgi:branched-chain amino acid transport system ATP-binding protein